MKNQKKGSSKNVTVIATSRNLKEAELIRDKIQGIVHDNTYVVTSLPRQNPKTKSVVVKYKNNSSVVGPEPLVSTTNVKSKMTSDVGQKSQVSELLF